MDYYTCFTTGNMGERTNTFCMEKLQADISGNLGHISTFIYMDQ